jgi:EF hand domain-containing protein
MRRIARAGWVFGVAAILSAASFGLTHHAEAAPRSVFKALDTDNDGTVDLAEAKAAASKLFDTLDRDHDGTLDRRELRGRMVMLTCLIAVSHLIPHRLASALISGPRVHVPAA